MRLAIIGTGCSGIFCLAALTENFEKNPSLGKYIESIDVIADSSSNYGDHRAFGKYLPKHFVLNTCDQSVDEFLPAWMAYRKNNGLFQTDLSNTHKTYSSRADFGFFLNEYYRELLQQLRRFISVREYLGAVSELKISCENSLLFHAGINRIHVDKVILCVGSGRIREAVGIDPYSTEEFMVPADASVGIIGSGLTSVDTLIQLERDGHSGKITVASRTARLPRVQSPQKCNCEPVEIEPLYLTKENITLEDFWSWIICEFDRAQIPRDQIDSLFCNATTTAESWSSELLGAKTQIRPWQERSFFLTSFMPDLWVKLSHDDKHKFYKQFRSTWLSNLVAIPYQNALSVQRLFDRGNLTITSLDQNSALAADFIVDASPFGVHEAKLNPLLRTMIRKEQAMIDEFGSLKLDWNSMKIISNQENKPLNNIYCVGEAAVGANFVTSSIEENFRMSRKVIANIVENEIPTNNVV